VVLGTPNVKQNATPRSLLEEAGCEPQFPPNCEPDVDTIEKAFTELKRHLRKEDPRSVDAKLTAAQNLY